MDVRLDPELRRRLDEVSALPVTFAQRMRKGFESRRASALKMP
jgi:hypothetical protein